MMRIAKVALLVLTAAATTMLGAAPSTAATGQEFGQHVSSCAQDMGFSGVHNPGMHQGVSGWDGLPC